MSRSLTAVTCRRSLSVSEDLTNCFFSLEDEELTEMARVGLCSFMFLFAKLNLKISFSCAGMSWTLFRTEMFASWREDMLVRDALISPIGALPPSLSEYASASDSESEDHVACNCAGFYPSMAVGLFRTVTFLAKGCTSFRLICYSDCFSGE